MKQPPAFQFYASDYLSSSNVQRMSLEEQGAYVRLLCFSWQDGSIPSDLSELARMCNVTIGRMERIWQRVGVCFTSLPDGRLVNPRLEEVRKGLVDFLQRKAEAGRNGGLRSGEARAKQKGSTASIVLEANVKQNEPLQSSVFSLQSPSKEEIQKPLATPVAVDLPRYSVVFEEFWAGSTKRGSKLEAFREWKKIKPEIGIVPKIHNGMAAWMESEQWQDETKQPHICRWLKRRGWEEIVPRSNGNGIEQRNSQAARNVLLRVNPQNSSGFSGEFRGSRTGDLSRAIAPSFSGPDSDGDGSHD